MVTNLQSMVVTESWISDIATTCGISQKEVCCPTRTSHSIKTMFYICIIAFLFGVQNNMQMHFFFALFNKQATKSNIYQCDQSNPVTKCFGIVANPEKKKLVQCSRRLKHNLQFNRVKKGGNLRKIISYLLYLKKKKTYQITRKVNFVSLQG